MLLQRLGELARLFLTLGFTAFGGPAAHIAMMEDEVVKRRGWLTKEEFLDLVGATNLIPGPNSTELALHIGRHRAGWRGLVVAGLCFILPAAFIVTVLAWAYVHFGSLPKVQGILYGTKPVVLTLLIQAIFRLSEVALKSKILIVLGLTAFFLAATGFHELIVLLVVGGLMVLLNRVKGVGANIPTTLFSVALWPLFLFFLWVGSVLFGSGYVLFAFVESDLVARNGWLTHQQLLDAIIVGQITPGPVLTSATFIGYLLHGLPGAFVSTLGIFLPSFLFVILSAPLVPKMRKSKLFSAFLDGVNVAALSLMALVTFKLGKVILVDSFSLALAALSVYVLFRFKLNSSWLMLFGAGVGMLITS